MALARIVLLFALVLFSSCASGPDTAFEPLLRRHGVLIRAPNAAEGAAFYEQALGYGRAGEWRSGRLIRLTGPENFYIEQTRASGLAPGPDEARAAIAFQVHDIEEAARRIEQRGARLPSGEIVTVGVGRSLRFMDTFGNIHSLIETAREAEFREPHIYNMGIRIPDSATAAARQLYGDVLGFPVMTEQYYPPSLPLLHVDGTFGFMIHENEDGEPEVRARRPAYLDQVGTILVFTVRDIDEVRAYLRSQRPQLNIGLVEYFELGQRFSFADEAGVVSEVWELQTP